MDIYVCLVHYPVLDKFANLITTSITNLDIHDIPRSCMTYGVKSFIIVNHYESQKEILQRVLNFWKTDLAKDFKLDRYNALSLINHCDYIEDAKKYVKKQEGSDPLVVTTTAQFRKNQLKFNDFKRMSDITSKRPVLLVFGTGNGLAESVHEQADFILEPIKGTVEYNHLSVRSAVAIVLDRISSENIKEEL